MDSISNEILHYLELSHFSLAEADNRGLLMNSHHFMPDWDISPDVTSNATVPQPIRTPQCQWDKDFRFRDKNACCKIQFYMTIPRSQTFVAKAMDQLKSSHFWTKRWLEDSFKQQVAWDQSLGTNLWSPQQTWLLSLPGRIVGWQ